MNRRWIGLAMVCVWMLSACAGRARAGAMFASEEASVYSDAGTLTRRLGSSESTKPAEAQLSSDCGVRTRRSGPARVLGATDASTSSDVGTRVRRASLSQHDGTWEASVYSDVGAARGNR